MCVSVEDEGPAAVLALSRYVSAMLRVVLPARTTARAKQSI